MAYAGGCQCGKVRYRADATPDRSSVCFCRMCQKASGGPLMAFARFPADRVAWSRPPAVFASSNVAERGFCADCGTPLFWRDARGAELHLTLFSLDDPSAITPGFVSAIERKAPWLDATDGLRPTGPGGEPAIVSRQRGDGPEAG